MHAIIDDIAVVGDITENEARAYAERAPKGCTTSYTFRSVSAGQSISYCALVMRRSAVRVRSLAPENRRSGGISLRPAFLFGSRNMA